MDNFNPYQILKEAINKVPFVKYALGVAGVAAGVAIIKSFQVENYTIPVISILIMVGFMILLFIFSNLTKSKEKQLKNAGFILIYTTVFITCISSVLLVSSFFFKWPYSITQYGITQEESNNNGTIEDKITITGRVIDEITKEDLDSVRVSINGSKESYYTDSFGNFIISLRKDSLIDSYRIEFYKKGFKIKVINAPLPVLALRILLTRI